MKPRVGQASSFSEIADDQRAAGGSASAITRARSFLAKIKFKLEIAIFAMLVVTWGAIHYADILLYKELVIGPQGNAQFRVDHYDDRQEGTGHSTLVIDPKDPMHGVCTLRPGFFPNPFCGYELVLADKGGTHGLDLSKYRSLTLDLTAKGPSKSIRIFIKNFDPRYSKPNVRSTSKFHTTEVFLRGERLRKTIPLTQFPVAEWWVVREQQDPQATQPEMNNVVSIDIDTATQPVLGRHEFLIHSVTLHGTVIALEDFYLIIIGCWVVAIALFLAFRIAGYRKRAAQERRLQELETERLQRAMDASEKASSAKSTFLSNMSHELRTPLNAILGYAQLIERGDTSPRFTAAARTIRESGAHLLTLINDILDLSKIEAGKVELNPATFDIRACLRGVEDMMRIRAAEKDLDFRCLVAADLPRYMVGDETRLRQILINLLGNAVKFTRRGAVTLNVSLVPSEGVHPMVRFEVQDTGIGLSSEDLERIFTPFEQAGSARGKASGTGLGLSISQQMVTLMGGTIEAESTSGSGSRFWFMVEFPRGEVAGASAPLRAENVTSYAGNQRTILIVDDIEANRLLLAQDLEDLGFGTFEAANGASAVELAERIRPDLVLMDLKMAVMDGFEATRQLRAREGFADLPIVALSASDSDDVKCESLKAGASAFLTKPVDRARLLETLESLLGLEWQGSTHPKDETGESREELVVPPAERMKVLLHLARSGNISAIRHQAREIIALDERYRPFGEKLQELARNFHSPALLELIERCNSRREAA